MLLLNCVKVLIGLLDMQTEKGQLLDRCPLKTFLIILIIIILQHRCP